MSRSLFGLLYHPVFVSLLLPPCGTTSIFFFFNDTATTEIYTLSLHDALPISNRASLLKKFGSRIRTTYRGKLTRTRSEEHTSELQSPDHLVCRLLLEKKKIEMQPVVTRQSPLCGRLRRAAYTRVHVDHTGPHC